MDLTHRFTVPATRDEAWTAFANLDRVAPCFPGATITSIDGDDFAGTIKTKLGPIALVYEGTGRYVDRDRDRTRLVIEAHGRDKRGNGTAVATLTVILSGNGEHTDVEVITDLSITGKPAQFGRGVISDVSDKLLDQFASCVSERFADGLGEPEPIAATTSRRSSEADHAADTVELGAVPGDIEEEPAAVESSHGGSLGGVDAPPDVDTRARSTPDPRVRAATPRPAYNYTPPANQARPDFDIVATVVPTLLKRYWPVLAGAGTALFVVSLVVKGARR